MHPPTTESEHAVFVTNPLFETPEAEQARLAQDPLGSLNNGLSQLPVTIHEDVEAKLILLPNIPFIDGTMPDEQLVVIPVEKRPRSNNRTDGGQIKRHNGSWNCIIVFSTDERYPVDGWQIVVPEARLVRGRLVKLAL